MRAMFERAPLSCTEPVTSLCQWKIKLERGRPVHCKLFWACAFPSRVIFNRPFKQHQGHGPGAVHGSLKSKVTLDANVRSHELVSSNLHVYDLGEPQTHHGSVFCCRTTCTFFTSIDLRK